MEYLLWVIVALLAYAVVAPLTSATTQDVPAAVVLFLSTAVFLALTIVVLLATGTADPAYATAPASRYIYVGGLFLGVGILAYFTALELGPVSVVVPIYGMFIVGSSVIGIIFLDETVTTTRLAGIGCAVLAIYLSAGGETE